MDTENLLAAAEHLHGARQRLNAADGAAAVQAPGTAYQYATDALFAVLQLLLESDARAQRVYEISLDVTSIQQALDIEQAERDALTS